MTGDLWTAPAAAPDVLSALDEDERYRRFDVLQARMGEVWDAMRLNHDDESVVVVPSITLDRAVARSGSLTQAYEERFLFLLMLLRQPRLRMVYVTSMPIAPEIIEYYLALLPGVIPSHARSRLSLVAVNDASPRSLSEKLLERPQAAAQDRGADPQPGALAPGALQHDRARAGRRAQPRHPDVRRRPAARRPRLQDRLPAAVRRGRRAAPSRRGGPAHARRDRRRDRRHAGRAADDAQRDREAQRGRLRGRATPSCGWRGCRVPGRPTSGRRSWSGLRQMELESADNAVRRLHRQVRRGRRDRRGAHRGRGAAEPQRPAPGAARRRGRAAVHARPAARWRQRPELPGLRLPGRARVRAADHRARRDDRAPAGRRRARSAGSRSTSWWSATAPGLDAVRHRAQPAQGRHHPPVPHAAVPHRRPLRPDDGAVPHAARPREAPGRHRPSRVRAAARAGAARTCSTSWPGTGCTSTSRDRRGSSST